MKMELIRIETNLFVNFTRLKDNAQRSVKVTQKEVEKFFSQSCEMLGKVTFESYQLKRRKTDKYTLIESPFCHALGLGSEVGEVQDKIDKMYRKTHKFEPDDDAKKEIAKELGDVLWYLSACADDIGYSLADIAEINLSKLEDRDKRNVICGSGDNR